MVFYFDKVKIIPFFYLVLSFSSSFCFKAKFNPEQLFIFSFKPKHHTVNRNQDPGLIYVFNPDLSFFYLDLFLDFKEKILLKGDLIFKIHGAKFRR